MHLIKQTPTRWAVLEGEVITKENLELDELLDYMLASKRDELRAHVLSYTPLISWDIAQCIAGRIKCADCGSTVEPESFEEKWILERQRCLKCKGG